MKKKNVAALVGVLSVFAIGGSLAYFNQTMEVENNFDTAKYGTTLTEVFKPSEGTDWEPGKEINKDVKVVNTGDRPVIVRIKMDEVWSRKNQENQDVAFAEIHAKDADLERNVTGDKIVTVYQKNPTDGDAKEENGKLVDDTVVHKNLVNKDKWIDGGDGYYYYYVPVPANSETELFLDSVKLDEHADMGAYTKVKYYSTDDGENWSAFTKKDGVELSEAEMEAELASGTPKAHITNIKNDVTLDANHKGYADADYALTITAQTVQVDGAAVKEAFKIATIPVDCEWGITLPTE